MKKCNSFDSFPKSVFLKHKLDLDLEPGLGIAIFSGCLFYSLRKQG